MTTLATDPQFKFYVLCSAILSLLALVLAGIAPARRANVKKYVNPEDSKVSPKDATINEESEHPEVARALRAHRNLLESLPLFFALGLISVLAGAHPLGTKICIGTYTGARIVHAIVYLKGVQPWRTVVYLICALALVGMVVLSGVALMG